MLSPDVHSEVLDLSGSGLSDSAIAKVLGIHRTTVKKYKSREVENKLSLVNMPVELKPHYAYVFGLYLGDGCIDQFERTYRLRIFLHTRDDAETIERLRISLGLIFPANKVSESFHHTENCTTVSVYSSLLPSLFPQHGSGKKHARDVSLLPDQDFVLSEFTLPFLCGLLDSDGSRYLRLGKQNRLTYQFTNVSKDILDLYKCCLAKYDISYSQAKKPTVVGHGQVYNILTQKLDDAKKLDVLCASGYDMLRVCPHGEIR